MDDHWMTTTIPGCAGVAAQVEQESEETYVVPETSEPPEDLRPKMGIDH